MILMHGANSINRGGGEAIVRIGENIYSTVTINGLTWTKTNLREKTGTYTTIANDPLYTIDRYGYLYSYASKSSLESLLPEGWRLPTGKDWMNLINYSGGNETGNPKVKATTDWKNTSGAKIGTDDFGFSLLPASTDGSGLRTYMWSVPDSTRSQNRFSVDWDGTYFFWYTDAPSYRRPWRAVKDA